MQFRYMLTLSSFPLKYKLHADMDLVTLTKRTDVIGKFDSQGFKFALITVRLLFSYFCLLLFLLFFFFFFCLSCIDHFNNLIILYINKCRSNQFNPIYYCNLNCCNQLQKLFLFIHVITGVYSRNRPFYS